MFRIHLSTAFGIESVVAYELSRLGLGSAVVENGGLLFDGDAAALARCNLWLRCAERVSLVLGEFPAPDYDALFDGIRGMPWADWLPEDAFIHVFAHTARSALASERTCQSMAKKAIIDRLRDRYRRELFSETGDRYAIDVRVENGRARILLDASGEGLHRRGYRKDPGSAPLRETTAAALASLLRWKARIPLRDPFCGSGTIAIEAALAARGMAPGRDRQFACERWFFLDQVAVRTAREEARFPLAPGEEVSIVAGDNDPTALDAARRNAARAGVADCIRFVRADAREIAAEGPAGLVLTNPPYGERLGEEEEILQLYHELRAFLGRFAGWRIAMLSGNPALIDGLGRAPDKNRKLYNGKLQCYLYTFEPRSVADGPA